MKIEMDEELKEFLELGLFSIIPIILIWVTLMGITFCYVDDISYSLGFWVYGILSSILGVVLTSIIISKARK